MARLKGLRGTVFDIFGYTAERTMERALIAWYEDLIDNVVARLPAQAPDTLLPLAKAPMDIRGYGPVKEAAVTQVKATVEKLLKEASVTATKEAA